MIRKDYIQRYFDELAKVLAAVLQLKNDLKPLEAETLLNEFSNDFLGFNLDEIINLKASDLIQYLSQEKQFTLTHFKILEDLIYHKYLLNPSNKIIKNCTLEVLNYLSKIDKDYSFNRMSRINELT